LEPKPDPTVSLAVPPKSYKDHAKIQLRFFYETRPGIRRPVVICFNKSACFRYDLCLRIYGGFHVSRTHGGLYDTLRQPEPRTIGLRAIEMAAMAVSVNRFSRY